VSGLLIIYKIPKFRKLHQSNAHSISLPHYIEAIAGRDNYFYTGDTLGYIKRFVVLERPAFSLTHGDIFRASEDTILDILILDDPEYIAVSSADWCVRLWNVERQTLIGVFHESAVWDLSNDGCANPFSINPNHFSTESNCIGRRAATALTSNHAPSHSNTSLNSSLFVDINHYKAAPFFDAKMIGAPESPSSVLSTPPYRAHKYHPSPTIDPSALSKRVKDLLNPPGTAPTNLASKPKKTLLPIREPTEKERLRMMRYVRSFAFNSK
jgi:hypothetical protein